MAIPRWSWEICTRDRPSYHRAPILIYSNLSIDKRFAGMLKDGGQSALSGLT